MPNTCFHILPGNTRWGYETEGEKYKNNPIKDANTTY